MRLDDDLMALEDRARSKLDAVLPAERYRTDLYRLALLNLVDTIENHENFEGNPEVAKQFNTRAVRSKYRINVVLDRP